MKNGNAFRHKVESIEGADAGAAQKAAVALGQKLLPTRP